MDNIATPTPNALQSVNGGYWTDERMAIWHRLTPEQRDYDRFQGWFPPGHAAFETQGGRLADEQRVAARDALDHDALHVCTCHINPPCTHCTDCTECQED